MSRGSFLLSTDRTTPSWSLTSVALRDAYTDFMLSRQAMNATKSTLDFYKNMLGKFLAWIEQQGITSPEEITGRHVRQFIAGLADAGYGGGKKYADASLWDYARSIRTMLRFWKAEGYVPEVVSFELPKKSKKHLPVLNGDQVKQLLKACNTRDKAIVSLMVDSGVRREEVCRLNWDDVNMQTGHVMVRQGKGRKDRSVVIGAQTRRALIAYRRTLKDKDGNTPLFKTRYNQRFTGAGLLRMFKRLSDVTGIHVTPHALRRTCAILCWRNGMDLLEL
jgi:site-specific recombinase XerD